MHRQEIDQSEHENSQTGTRKVLLYGWDSVNLQKVRILVDSNGNIISSPPTTLGSGKKLVTTAGTRVQLASTTSIKGLSVKALSTNTGLIYIGDVTVASSNGFQLSAGDEQSFDISDLASLYVDSAVNGEGVTYFWVN